MRTPAAVVFSLILSTMLAACGGGGSAPAPATPAPAPPPVVTLTAPATQVLAGAKALTISATGAGSASISWALAADAPGSIAANGATAQYTPPAAVAANTLVTITAKAGATSQSLTLTVYPEPGAAGLSLIAGTLGERALLDGSGATARFANMADAAPAIDGGLLVADANDEGKRFNALRKIGLDRKVSTLLRTAPGHADGDAGQARLGRISGLAQTADGAIWFLDSHEGRSHLRRFAAGRVSTLFDNGRYGIGRLYAAGSRLYLATATTVLSMPQDGAVPALLAGADVAAGETPVDGTGAAARFTQIGDLAIAPTGELVVADRCLLRKVSAAGVVSTVAGHPLAGCTMADGAGDAARFRNLRSVAVNAAGEVLVLDENTVRKWSASGMLQSLLTVPAPAVQTGYQRQSYPRQLRLSGAGDVLLVREGQIDQLDGGQLRPYAGLEDDSAVMLDGMGAAARFTGPLQLSADLAGNLYVIDDHLLIGGIPTPLIHRGLRLRKIAPDGKVSTLIHDDALPLRPAGIANAPDGTLYLVVQQPEARARLGGGALYKIGADGSRTLLAGPPDIAAVPDASVDGQGEAARFTAAWMAGVDSAGDIYINDAGKVRKVTPGGMVTTVAALPAGLGKAPDGFVYKLNADDASVLRVNADGSESLAAGGAALHGTVLGPLPGGLGTVKALAPTGPYTFALIANSAILKLVLPH